LGNLTQEKADEPIVEETVITDYEKIKEQLDQTQETTEKLEAEIEETAEEWNIRRAEEIAEENDLIIKREQEAEEIRKHAETYKRDQVVKMERSGFWGWLKGIFWLGD
jgi:crotonobetainyl-CoA:carnitine CoA-transferase CaiB-like acyl-CoA transferase